jgi:hypothetical protein
MKIRVYKTIIMPAALYGCETWSEMFENRVLRRIFGPKRDEVTGDWRKLHNEELHNLYSSPNITRMIRIKEVEMGRACNTNGRRGMHMGYWWERQKERDH